MLNRIRRLLSCVVVVCALTTAGSAPAFAGVCADGSDPIPVEQCDAHGNCSVQLTCPDDDGGGGGGGESSSTCTHQGETIPCDLPGVGPWNGECYLTPTHLEEQPPPPPPAGQNGGGGAWYYCIYPSGGGTYAGTAWIEDGTAFVNPVVMARRAIASMDLNPINIGIVPESGPDRMGLVGLPVWMWVDTPTDNTFGPITASDAEGSVSVTATAAASIIAWHMGDGTVVTCAGVGTPYADRFGLEASPTCGHRYETMSSDQPGGAYQVSATSHWIVAWTGGGQTGTIELDLTTDEVPIRIG